MPETHVVRDNDGLNSLWSVAEHYRVSWQELLEANPKLKDRRPEYGLNVGDEVFFPDKRWVKHRVKSCKTDCPPYYLLVIKITLATGTTENGSPMANHALPLNQTDTKIEFHLDYKCKSFRQVKAPVDGELNYVRGQPAPLVRVITKKTFDQLQTVLVWAPGMLASFRRVGSSESAFARVEVDRSQMKVEAASVHPITNDPLPTGSQKITVALDILEHPAQYILREMILHAQGNEIPTNDELGLQGFILLGVRWAEKARTGKDWDYKRFGRIGGIWGNFVRLDNDADAILNDGFSNLHYGYVGAVGGLRRLGSRSSEAGSGSGQTRRTTSTPRPRATTCSHATTPASTGSASGRSSR